MTVRGTTVIPENTRPGVPAGAVAEAATSASELVRFVIVRLNSGDIGHFELTIENAASTVPKLSRGALSRGESVADLYA